ncbi:MAG: DNA repair protein RecN [Prevotella sp.]|nr:DNA repair protein RecN [Prevotella sp.]MCM1074200.1 DNA repair protein RecN [Ruminococcus sp.]
MLKRLYISNYALIEQLDIPLSSGLTIITGETGAGKSILLGALSLLLGARSDIKKARNPEQKIIVEGTFDAVGFGLQELFAENSLDWDDELILRREVSASGRSRAFVNDTPVTTTFLAQVASRLVDIHSQHQNLLIGSRNFQISVLDALSDNDAQREAYTVCFREYVEMRKILESKRSMLTRSRENEEFLRFRLEQLRKLKPRPGEQKELERRQEILADSASLSETISSASALLNVGDNSVLSRLHEVKSLMQGVNFSLFAEEDSDSQSFLPARLESALIELTDISETLTDYLDKVDTDPRLLNKVEERLSSLYEASRRFKVSDADELITLLEEMEQEYAAITGGETDISELETRVKEKGKQLKKLADDLSQTRRATAELFASKLIEVAAPLGMHNLKFSIILSAGKLTASGQDQPSFQCAFNKNQPLLPVEKIASGGEIARLMLCLKAIVASRMNLPTVIFDEVDTGVSGDIAARMALLMREISANIQVLAITHLPQIAAAGDAHLMVYKQDSAEATHTHIRELSQDERVGETARMLAGTTVDEAALTNARSLIEQYKDFGKC